MDLILRQENETEHRAVEELTREAFWNHFSPGCNEHYLVHIMRDADAFIKELDFVAIYGAQIVGNIMYTKAHILGDDKKKHPVLCFGPVSVFPEFQNRGIGSRLIEHTKELAKELGYTSILIFGDPAFYKKLDFVQAENFSIGTSQNTYADALLACELIPHALDNCKGRLFEDKIFEIDAARAEEFDKLFSPKNKLSGLPIQARFSELVAMSKPRQ